MESSLSWQETIYYCFLLSSCFLLLLSNNNILRVICAVLAQSLVILSFKGSLSWQGLYIFTMTVSTLCFIKLSSEEFLSAKRSIPYALLWLICCLLLYWNLPKQYPELNITLLTIIFLIRNASTLIQWIFVFHFLSYILVSLFAFNTNQLLLGFLLLVGVSLAAFLTLFQKIPDQKKFKFLKG